MAFIFTAGLTPLKTAIRTSNSSGAVAAKPAPAECHPIITRRPSDGSLDRISGVVGDSAAKLHRLDWERIARHATRESEFLAAISGLKQQIAWKTSSRKSFDEVDSVVYSCKAS